MINFFIYRFLSILIAIAFELNLSYFLRSVSNKSLIFLLICFLQIVDLLEDIRRKIKNLFEAALQEVRFVRAVCLAKLKSKGMKLELRLSS